MRRLLFLLPLIGFFAVTVWGGLALFRDGSARLPPSTLIDQPVPDFALPPLRADDTDGLATADLAGGGPVLVNVFASWCVPCLAEHPLLTRLAEEEGVVIHAINFKDTPADARAWLARHGDPFARIGIDPEGRGGIEWGVTGVPETFVVDGDGRVRWRYAGPLTPPVVDQTLRPLLAELGG